MRKLTVLSVITASLLLIGCGQEKAAETKAEVATPAKTETVAEKATKAVEATKEAATAAVEKTKEVAKEAKKAVAEKATKAVEATKEVATAAAEKTAEVAKDVKEAVAPKAEKSSAPAAFAKCAGCHGKDGKMKALGKSEVIAGQAKADLVKKIGEYKAGTRNVSGMGGLMKGQVAALSDADIDAIATYVSGIK